MKKIISIILIAVLACTLLVACGEKQQTPAKPDEQAETTKGGFKVASHNAVIEGNPYRTVYEEQMTEAVEAAKKEGLISQYASFTSNNDPAVQSQQVEQTVNEGYDIIMVNPIAATGLDPIIDKALAAGITYINADCEYESEKF